MKFSHKIEYAECRIVWPKLKISREIRSIWKWVGPHFYLFCCCQFSFWFFELILLFPDYLNIKRPSINRQWYCYKPFVSPIATRESLARYNTDNPVPWNKRFYRPALLPNLRSHAFLLNSDHTHFESSKIYLDSI